VIIVTVRLKGKSTYQDIPIHSLSLKLEELEEVFLRQQEESKQRETSSLPNAPFVESMPAVRRPNSSSKGTLPVNDFRSHDRFEFGARACGLLVLVLAAGLCYQFIWATEAVQAPAKERAHASKDCLYQVFVGDACAGTLFTDGPRDAAAIVEQLGARLADVRGSLRQGEAVPCDSAIRLDEHGSLARVEKIPGRQLLLAGRPIDLNTADNDDLAAIHGVGPRLAAEILRYRERSGPFKSVEQLRQVRGIGKKKLEAIEKQVRVGRN
jgi:competence ComEA-like helix-hairpin-helix protein